MSTERVDSLGMFEAAAAFPEQIETAFAKTLESAGKNRASSGNGAEGDEKPLSKGDVLELLGQFREEDRVNQLREQAIRDRRTQLQALGATADEIDQDIAQNSIAILQAAMGAANLEGQRDRLVSTAREAAREAGREGGRTAREAWIDAFDAPRLMAGGNILLLSEGDRRQAEEIRRLFAETRREAERAAEISHGCHASC